MSTLGTVLTMVSGLGTFTFLFSLLVLASHGIIPEDPDNTLFYIVASIISIMIVGVVVGISLSGIGDRRERKKQKAISDSVAKKNTVPL